MLTALQYSYGEILRLTISCEMSRTFCLELPSGFCSASAEKSSPCYIPLCLQTSLETHQIFRGLSTEPSSASTMPYSPCYRKSCSSTWPEADRHSTRSQFRDLPPATSFSNSLLGGGRKPAADGVWVDCFSPTQSKPGAFYAPGKKGEQKRWRQFLIRGDPKRGKRSFRRAQRRADLQGQTTYKGQVIHGRGKLGNCGTQARTGDDKPDNAFVERRPVLSWNAGGLSAETKVEFEHYLQNCTDADICFVQETHWGSSGTWRQHGWVYFHSASERPRQAGVLVCIRSSVLEESQAAWREIVPGRLIWVRANIRGQQWDLLNLYQVAQAGRDGETKDYRLKERRSIWNKLQKTLQGLPFRSLVVLGGDFNLSLEVFSPVTGCGVVSGSMDRDAREERAKVLDLLNEAQLTLLNTWGKPLPTYQHPTGNTQIDFIAVRRRSADRISRLSKPVELGLASWRGCGHVPLYASIRAVWQPWKHKHPKPRERSDVVPAGEEQITQLRRQVKTLCTGPSAKLRKPELRSLDEQVERHWETRRQLRHSRSWKGTLRHAFELFRAVCKAQQAHRELKRQCRYRKREQLLSLLDSAEEAFRQGDSKAFFGFVRLASPKQFLPQIKLRGAEGQLLSQEQEGQLLLAQFARFSLVTSSAPALVRVSEEVFSAQNWERALREVKVRKAVPRGEAQIAARKTNITGHAQKLSELSIRFLCSEKPWIPTLWCRIQIAWLPKPKNTPCHPEHLRTVGLMSGDSKAFMVLLKNAAHAVVQRSMQSFPQFAYRSGASTLDAILRVTGHCHHVRGVLEGVSSPKAARLMGSELPELRGGLMVAIDLTKAFDNVTYSCAKLGWARHWLD